MYLPNVAKIVVIDQSQEWLQLWDITGDGASLIAHTFSPIGCRTLADMYLVA